MSSYTGVDGHGNDLSAALLGTSQTWDGSTFTIGSAASAANVVSGAGQTIALTQGKYGTLEFLATHVNGSAANLSFTVTYTDGSTQTFTQGVADWYSPQGYAGSHEAVKMAYRDTASGGKDARTFYVYGFTQTLSATKTVKSLTLPNDNHFKLLAVDLAPAAGSAAVVRPAVAVAVAPTAATASTDDQRHHRSAGGSVAASVVDSVSAR